MNQTNWTIDDNKLKPGLYYHEFINALAIVSGDNWILVGAKKPYPLYGWRRIGGF